jgi:hypothetical protein
MRELGRPPSTTWRTFVRAHLAGTVAIDFLTVPTVTFSVPYVFFVLSLGRRKLPHSNVTDHPHQTWTAQQVVEAVGFDTEIARLIRDRDRTYGTTFDSRVNHLSVRQLKIAPKSPWQNGYAERFVGTLRREVLDYVIVLGERHLLRLVRSHAAYYNEDRPHMSLDRDAPVSRTVEPPSAGRVVAFPRVAGLHHATRGSPDPCVRLFGHHRRSRSIRRRPLSGDRFGIHVREASQLVRVQDPVDREHARAVGVE